VEHDPCDENSSRNGDRRGGAGAVGCEVIIREDSWKPGPTIKFREHEGRGYWKGDSWVEIK
jgi:hypothetical protein